jgi:hypothetical protein
MFETKDQAEARWHEDPTNREKLLEALRDPVLCEAVRIVLLQERPQLIPTDVRPDVLLARESAFQSGIHAFPEKLLSLTRPPVATSGDLEPDFEYLSNQ